MANQSVQTKAQLLVEIDQSWVALHAYLANLSEAQMTTIHDDHDWTVKDHLTHIADWENSVVFFLQGKPRFEGLGIERTLFENHSVDEINGVVQQLHKDLSLDEVTSQLQTTHRQLSALLEPLTEADLNQPLDSYHPESRDGNHRQVIDIIRDNTSGHFLEHLGWIKTLISPLE